MNAKIEWTEKDIADFRKLCSMDSEVEGVDGIQVHSCFTNGSDTAIENGFKPESPEFQDASDYYTLMTARFFEVI